MILKHKKRTGIAVVFVSVAFLLIFVMLSCQEVYGREADVQVKAVSTREGELRSCEFFDTCSSRDIRYRDFQKHLSGIAPYALGESVDETGLLGSGLQGAAWEIYDAIAQANLTSDRNTVEISFPIEEDQSLQEVYDYYRDIYPIAMWAYEYDHLEQFYWNYENTIMLGAESGQNEDGFFIILEFTYAKSEYYSENLEELAKRKLQQGVQAARTYQNLPDKLMVLNEWVCENCSYDREGIYAAEESEEAYYAYSMMGLLIKGRGVCEAYAKTFKLLCQELDIPCVFVVSDSHAFNYVRVDDSWYMIDTTWNDSGDHRQNYRDYFLISNEPPIDWEHKESDLFTYPQTSVYNYYKKFQPLFVADEVGDEISSMKLNAGKTASLTVYGAESKVKFTSSDPTIASVSSKGLIQGIKPGTVTIKITAAETMAYEESSVSVTVSVRPGASASVSLSNTSNGIKVSWEKVPYATGYYVYRGSDRIKTISSGNTLSYVDEGSFTNGSKYTYKVFAYAENGISCSNKSASIYRLSKPKISSLTNSAAKKMTVKYNKNSKANGYKIQYATSSNFTSAKTVTVTVTSATTVTKVIASLTKGKTYYVRVRSYKKVSGVTYQSTWSDKKAVKIKK